MAISDARWKVIDEWQEKQSSKGSILDRSERKIGDKDITDVPYYNDDADELGSFNVDAQDSKLKSHTVLVDRDGVSPYFVPIHDVKGETFSSSSNMISSVVQQLRKPPVDMMVFKGNPLEYRRFVRQFKANVLVNTDNNDERLNYLEQFTDGEVKNIVQRYGYLDAERGFPAVMKELEQRYGDDAVIVNAFIEKALNWPLIRADNPKQLDAYAVYLSECEHAVNSNILDYTEHIRNLVVKLPYQYQERFRTLVQTLKDSGRNVKFTDLVQFVRKKAKKVNDPMFGRDALQNKFQMGSSASKTMKSQVTKSKPSLATEITPKTTCPPKVLTWIKQKTAVVQGCANCDSVDHAISDCPKFIALSVQEKVKFLQRKGLCFRCFKHGHMSKLCRGNIICSVCQQRHHTLLHDDRSQTDSGRTSAITSCVGTDMAVGDDSNTLCTVVIVPVKVMMKDGLHAVDTYAFLDPGSSATFCTESLMTKLGAGGKSLKINIDSMGKPCTMNTHAISGMQVCDPFLENKILRPKLYTVNKLPVSQIHIPTSEDISCWPHLRDIKIPHLETEIGLMIGNNVPDAYAPVEVRTGPKHAPHATRTRLGWTLWNVTRHTDRSGSKKPLKCSVNRTMVTAVEEADTLKQLDTFVRQSFNVDFPERAIDDEKQNSQEDKIFLKRVQDSIVFKNTFQTTTPWHSSI